MQDAFYSRAKADEPRRCTEEQVPEFQDIAEKGYEGLVLTRH